MVIMFVIITSIVLEIKRKKLEELEDKNEIVKPIEKPDKDEGDVSIKGEEGEAKILIKKKIIDKK